MQFINNEIRFSPSDLTKFMESGFASWMDRWFLEKKIGNHSQTVAHGFDNLGIEACEPDEMDAEMEIIASKGIEHEKKFLDSLPSNKVVEIPSNRHTIPATLEAMGSGAEVVFQAHLVHGQFGGYADFLMKVPGDSLLGDYHYEVADTKLARSPKPYFIIQLCCYADLLESIQGRRPTEFEVVLGTGERVRFDTAKYYFYYESLKSSFLKFHKEFDINEPPHPGKAKTFGRWAGFAEQVLEASNHLSQVAKITRSQIKKLESVGVTTTTQLGTQKIDNVPKLAESTLRTLQWQARMQLDSAGKDRPLFDVITPKGDGQRLGLELLPSSSPNDVFFDMEGYPLVDGGLEYLLGASHFEHGELKFSDWWAHEEQQERLAFEGFIDWAHARWQADPTMHIYHYAPYEVSTIKRLMGKYATREDKVDDLLRNQVFVDLYAVVRQGIVLGASSYSLKSVEKLYMDSREGEVTTSGGSIVAYHDWILSGQAEDWNESKILKEIRDYNEVDCVSTWKLTQWLRDVQSSNGIEFVPAIEPPAQSKELAAPRNSYNDDAVVLADRLIELANDQNMADDDRRLQLLHAWLLEFHWREARPVFWRKHSMSEMTDSELVDEQSCLGSLVRMDVEPEKIKRSLGYRYKFDAQETKLHAGSRCLFANNIKQRTQIVDLDPVAGTVQIKLGPSVPDAPNEVNLIPDEYISAKRIADAVFRYVESWAGGFCISQAVDDLLNRRPPRISDHAGGAIVQSDAPLLDATIDTIQRLDHSTLCIQGPPGTGKTYTAAKAIVQLLRDGKSIAVTANGHKAILNVLKSVKEEIDTLDLPFEVFKVGGSADECDELDVNQIDAKMVQDVADTPCVVGGTAWVFSREELAGQFDYLFVDEAGQFSLANVVGTGCCSANIVLFGDQMQLASPTQGAHPGESGLSALEYYLDGKPTIPSELGILLNQSWRMNPAICDFISDAIYESRLESHPKTANQRIVFDTSDTSVLRKSHGIQFVPTVHSGNTQCSEEEVEVIAKLYDDLLRSSHTDFDGVLHDSLTSDDILVVAPFNMQVRLLQERLGPAAKVGTVDKFQGQQAPVVIVSMCSSTLEEAPRGAQFLLNPNRLNVAISRAKALSIVVGNPEIAQAECSSIEEMELVNLYCRAMKFSSPASSVDQTCHSAMSD